MTRMVCDSDDEDLDLHESPYSGNARDSSAQGRGESSTTKAQQDEGHEEQTEAGVNEEDGSCTTKSTSSSERLRRDLAKAHVALLATTPSDNNSSNERKRRRSQGDMELSSSHTPSKAKGSHARILRDSVNDVKEETQSENEISAEKRKRIKTYSKKNVATPNVPKATRGDEWDIPPSPQAFEFSTVHDQEKDRRNAIKIDKTRNENVTCGSSAKAEVETTPFAAHTADFSAHNPNVMFNDVSSLLASGTSSDSQKKSQSLSGNQNPMSSPPVEINIEYSPNLDPDKDLNRATFKGSQQSRDELQVEPELMSENIGIAPHMTIKSHSNLRTSPEPSAKTQTWPSLTTKNDPMVVIPTADIASTSAPSPTTAGENRSKKRKRAKDETNGGAEDKIDELGSEDSIGMPKDMYKPRPTRSRSVRRSTAEAEKGGVYSDHLDSHDDRAKEGVEFQPSRKRRMDTMNSDTRDKGRTTILELDENTDDESEQSEINTIDRKTEGKQHEKREPDDFEMKYQDESTSKHESEDKREEDDMIIVRQDDRGGDETAGTRSRRRKRKVVEEDEESEDLEEERKPKRSRGRPKRSGKIAVDDEGDDELQGEVDDGNNEETEEKEDYVESKGHEIEKLAHVKENKKKRGRPPKSTKKEKASVDSQQHDEGKETLPEYPPLEPEEPTDANDEGKENQPPNQNPDQETNPQTPHPKTPSTNQPDQQRKSTSPQDSTKKHSPINKGKVPFKVGLSKRARIEPLLRVVRK